VAETTNNNTPIAYINIFVCSRSCLVSIGK
jgi:hypothetical protein